MLGTVTNVLVVNPALPVSNVKEFIAYAKANPGKVNFSHAGVGSSMSLAAELFKMRAGVELVSIPYKGTGAAVTAVPSGEVQCMFPIPRRRSRTSRQAARARSDLADGGSAAPGRGTDRRADRREL